MALNWITEPSDYIGTVGSVMLVEGSVEPNLPDPILPSDYSWSVYYGSNSGVTIDTQPSSVSLFNTPNDNIGCGYKSQSFDISQGGVFSFSLSLGGSTAVNFKLRTSTNKDFITLYINDSSVFAYFNNVRHDFPTFDNGDTIHLQSTFVVGGDTTVVLTQGTLSETIVTSTFGLTDGYFYIYGLGGDALTTDILLQLGDFITFDLEDKDGIIRDTQVSTDGLYSHSETNMEELDSGEWVLKATQGEEIATSPFSVVVSDIEPKKENDIKQGETSITISPQKGYSVDAIMALHKSIDSRGFVQWFDDTAQYDNYRTEFSFNTSTPKAMEEFIVSDSEDTVELTTSNNEYGFFPFGFGFATNQNYPVNIKTVSNNSETLFGEIKEYTFSTFQAVRGVYASLVASSQLIGKVEQHWSIAGVYFPFVKTKNSLNDMRFVSEQNGDSAQVVDTTKPYGDIADIVVDVSEEQARLIMQFFTLTMRGTERVAVFPLGYNLFGRRYEELTTCRVKLFDEKITQKHINLDSVEISFKLQMVGV